jgi:hypothetical protein
VPACLRACACVPDCPLYALPAIASCTAEQYRAGLTLHRVDRSDAWYFRDYVHGILGCVRGRCSSWCALTPVLLFALQSAWISARKSACMNLLLVGSSRPLPPNSIYLAAYDIQWTAVAYMQKCEGYR